MNPLPLRLPYEPGEPPSSYASRLAARNFRSAADFVLDFEISMQGLCDGNESSIGKLAALGDADPAEMLASSMVKVSRTSGGMFAYRGQMLMKAGLRRVDPRVCPACLAHDIEKADLPPPLAVRNRIVWQISAVRTCAVHGVPLIAVPGKFTRRDNYDWTERLKPMVPEIQRLAATAATRDLSALETYALERLDGAAQAPWLDGFPFYSAILVSELVGAVAVFGRRAGIKTMTDDQLREAGDAGVRILQGGPEALREFLAKLHRDYPIKTGHKGRAEGPSAVFGKLYMAAQEGMKTETYAPLRTVMKDYILEHFPLAPGKTLFGEKVAARRLHTIRSASKEHGMHPKRLRKLLAAAGHVEDGTFKDSQIVVDAAAMARFADGEADRISLKKTETYINASRPTAAILRDAGIIEQTGTGTAIQVFSKAGLDDFLDRLQRRTRVVDQAPPGIYDLRIATKKAKCSIVDIVTMILDDRLSWVGRLRGTSGVHSIMVDPQEVRSNINRRQMQGLTMQKAERYMHISHQVRQALIRVGAIVTTRELHPTLNHLVEVISLDEIERFNRTYVSLSELARELKQSLATVRGTLASAGFYPAPELQDVPRFYYRRDRLPKI